MSMCGQTDSILGKGSAASKIMEIRTRLKRGYILKQSAIAVVSIALGLWGVYDYVWTIPNQQEAHDRLDVCQAIVALHETEPDDETFEQKKEVALEKVQAKLDDLAEQAGHQEDSPEVAPATEQEALDQQVANLKKTIEQLDAQGELGWLKTLLLFRQAVVTPRPPATMQSSLSGIHAAAWEIATQGVSEFAEVSKPETYDRVIKGLIFIPCLPFGLYMLGALAIKNRKHYRLDKEGNLHLPGGETWNRDDIQDINMNKWMSKSIARPQHADGREVKLDDYIHQDMHLIVGGLAHRFHPDQWHEDARKVKTEDDELEGDDDSGSEDVADDNAVETAERG